MAKGKYAHRADSRLKVLESEALREAHAKINELESQIGAAKHEADVTRADMQSQAMRVAQGLSAREKQNLRDRIASLEHQSAEERVRNAVLMWEIMHRNKFERPAPAKIYGDAYADRGEETAEQMKESWDYWISAHWEIAALFFSDYDEMQQFFLLAEGHEWRIAGDVGWSARQAHRALHVGRMRDNLMRREYQRRKYFERIWQARQGGKVEPIEKIDIIGDDTDIKEGLLKNMYKKAKTNG